MSDVFISYKRENLAAVGRLVEALRAEGIGVWWDQDIPPNAAWEATIERALAAAKLVIVAWSPASVASENVKAEARGARAQGRLLQVFVDACEPPLFFGERQGVDLKSWSGAASEAAFRSVLEAIRSGLGSSGSPSPDIAPAKSDLMPPLPSKPSIAVLPFTNITGGKDEDYFSDGMVEEIVTALSRFPALFVIASASSLTYRGDSRGQGKIATELGVRYLLDGSVRRSGARVRIAVKLADALEGEQIWAERFDGDLDDVFALQDEVATAVAGQIAPTIEAADTRWAHARPTSDLSAYEFYLRALHRERDFDQQALQDTVALLDQALTVDPHFARALALQSMMHSIPDLVGRPDLLGQNEDPAAYRRLSLDLARRAMSEGSDDPEVLGVVSNTFLWAGEDIAVADALAERALALNPGASFVWFPSAWVKLFGGRPALAIEQFETHLRLDPRSPNRHFVNGGMGLAQLLLRHFEAAIPLLREAIQQVPEHPFYRAGLAAACGHLGRTGEAAPHLRALNPNQIRSVLDLLRLPEDREVVRSGLALAGADV
jgi:TolB-like protein